MQFWYVFHCSSPGLNFIPITVSTLGVTAWSRLNSMYNRDYSPLAIVIRALISWNIFGSTNLPRNREIKSVSLVCFYLKIECYKGEIHLAKFLWGKVFVRSKRTWWSIVVSSWNWHCYDAYDANGKGWVIIRDSNGVQLIVQVQTDRQRKSEQWRGRPMRKRTRDQVLISSILLSEVRGR